MKFYHNDFGTIELKESAQSKSIRITIKAFNKLLVTYPRGVHPREAIKFLNKKKKWIGDSQKKMRVQLLENPTYSLKSPFSTKLHSVHFEKNKEDKFRLIQEDKKIKLCIPAQADITDPEIQAHIDKQIVGIYRYEAKIIIPPRVKEIAEKHNLKVTGLSINTAKTRWGSCSSKNRLNFSAYLMKVSDHLIDYVIYHELAHTVHKNHSHEFWDFLVSMLPSALEDDRALNQISLAKID